MNQIELSNARESNFTVTMNRFPNFEFFVTDGFLPSITLSETPITFNGSTVFRPDNGIQFDPISVGFMVDERYTSYLEMFDWIHEYADPQGPRSEPMESSSLLVNVLDNNKNPILLFEFIEVWPINLGQVVLNTQGENNVLTCDITLRYDYIKYQRLDIPLPTSLPE